MQKLNGDFEHFDSQIRVSHHSFMVRGWELSAWRRETISAILVVLADTWKVLCSLFWQLHWYWAEQNSELSQEGSVAQRVVSVRVVPLITEGAGLASCLCAMGLWVPSGRTRIWTGASVGSGWSPGSRAWETLPELAWCRAHLVQLLIEIIMVGIISEKYCVTCYTFISNKH